MEIVILSIIVSIAVFLSIVATWMVMVGTEETGGMAEMVAGIEWARGSVAHSFRRSARV